jgi:hypothetical protein
MYSLSQINIITNFKKKKQKKKQEDHHHHHPFLGIAARRVYICAIELNPLTSPDLRRFPESQLRGLSGSG